MERWNEINFILSEKVKPDISEAEFERHVVEALRILGWSEYRGELSIRPSFNIGASNRITPDIIVKNDNQNLFVVEIKQPSISLNARFAQQLTSYLRFLRLETGVIIGEKIQLFYDDKTTGDDAFLFEEIEFVRDNPKGKEFVDLFCKENFDREKIIQKVQEKKAALEHRQLLQKLMEQLLVPEFESRIKELLNKELLKEYPDSVVEEALNEISIQVKDTTITSDMEPLIPSYRKTVRRVPPSIPASGEEMRIGEFVRTTFAEVKDKIDRKELENLQRQDYSKNTFDIQFPFLRKVLSSDTKKPLRYWKNPVQLFGEWYYMCSEWYEVPQNNDRPYYEAWLRKIRK